MELLASDTSSIEGGPPFSAEPHGWGISMSVSGEFQRARSKMAIRAAIGIEESGETPALATRWAAGFPTGARPAELMGLEWDRVDADHGVIDLA